MNKGEEKSALDIALDPKASAGSSGASPSGRARASVHSKDNVKVVIRVRPMNERESKCPLPPR